ncbi:hypothetical protein PENTCL1PPCAC_23326 [Pristionchus entomophagus]|uniref:ZP domain-containing protein n=1 Tax=Pristionchus entomophagus TaxID=358040 RepID=A0AAV5U473_9BILA|nr:hypothetical protein PENTCL1PPCAC_23326 [Pristionchus entomophagus]
MRLLLLLLALIQSSRSQSQIDNEVVGEPQVRCDDTSIVVNVRTKNTFKGNIFVRGYFSDPACRVECSTNDYAGATIAVSLVGCGVSRVRQIQPPGMNYLTTVEIAFHPLVITRRDKAFNIRCFYAHTDQEVKNGLTVSALPTQSVEQATVIRPQCVYSIRLGSLDGPIATSASVGDMTFHRWECDNPNYGMLVKNCCVNSGTNSPVTIQVIDDRGCPITSSLLQSPLKYAPSGTLVWAEIDAYKFPDQMKVVFTCDIAVCAKIDGQCTGVTPPDCSKARPVPFSTANSGGPFRSRARAETQTSEPKVTAEVIREPRFQSSFPTYDLGRFPTSPPIDRDDDLLPTVRAVAEGGRIRQGLERFSDALRAPWPMSEGIVLHDEQFNDDDKSVSIDVSTSSERRNSPTTASPMTNSTERILNPTEFRDAILAVVDKYNEIESTTMPSSTTLSNRFSTSKISMPTSSTPIGSSSTSTTLRIPALPSTLPPPFDPRDFTIPQAAETERERLGLSKEGLELLPPLIRLIRTTPTLESLPLLQEMQQDKSFDEVLQVTAEMLVSPVEMILNGTVPGIFSFLTLTSLIALFYAIAQCYFTYRNRLWMDDRLSIDQSSSYSPHPISHPYTMPYGSRRLAASFPFPFVPHSFLLPERAGGAPPPPSLFQIRTALLVALSASPMLACIGGGSGGGCCPPAGGPSCGPSVPPCSSSQPSYLPPPPPPAPLGGGYAVAPPAFGGAVPAYGGPIGGGSYASAAVNSAPLSLSAPSYAQAQPVFGGAQQQQGAYQAAPVSQGSYQQVQQQGSYQATPVSQGSYQQGPAAPVYSAQVEQHQAAGYQQAPIAGPVVGGAAYQAPALVPEAVQADSHEVAQSITEVQTIPTEQAPAPQYEPAAEIEEIVPAESHDDAAAVAAQIGDQVSAAAEAVQPAAPQYPATTF